MVSFKEHMTLVFYILNRDIQYFNFNILAIIYEISSHFHIFYIYYSISYNCIINFILTFWISFLDFEIHKSQFGLTYDHLNVYDGTSTSDPIIERLYGPKIPRPISSSNDIFLEFHSNHDVTARGFKFVYTYGKCGGWFYI